MEQFEPKDQLISLHTLEMLGELRQRLCKVGIVLTYDQLVESLQRIMRRKNLISNHQGSN